MYRLQFAALLLLVLVTGFCHAEVAEVECTAEGNCVNLDAEDAPVADERNTGEVKVEEVVAHEIPEEPKPEEDPNCPSREYVIRCAGQYLDTNKNGKLDRSELESSIDSLPWYARGILQILGSVDKMMKKCDIDGDDAISMDYDMEHNKDQCLATCFKRRAFKKAFFDDCE